MYKETSEIRKQFVERTLSSVYLQMSISYAYGIRIGEYAFADCVDLESVKADKPIDIVNQYAFMNCTKLSYMNFKCSNLHLGEGAFKGCAGLSTLRLGNYLSEYGGGSYAMLPYYSVFNDCVNMKNLDLPNYRGNFSTSMMVDGCVNLSKLSVPKCTRFDVIESSAFHIPLSYVSQSQTQYISIKSSPNIKYVNGDYANGYLYLDNCENLECVTPKNTAYYGSINSYWESSPLSSKVGSYASAYWSSAISNNLYFNNCPKLTNIDMGYSATIPGNLSMSYNNIGITDLYLRSCATLSAGYFNNCSNLSTVNLPKVVNTYNGVYFDNCPNLHTINLTALRNMNFRLGRLPKLEYFSVPACVSITFGAAFSNTGIKRLIFPALKSINGAVFQNTATLEKINIEELEYAPDGYLFANCKKLELINLPKLSNLGNNAFEGCDTLSYAYLGSITRLKSSVFKNCPKLKQVTVDLKTDILIDKDAFGGTTNLKTLYLAGGHVAAPVGDIGIRQSTSLSNCTMIMVDASMYSAYQNHASWANYKSLIFPRPNQEKNR